MKRMTFVPGAALLVTLWACQGGTGSNSVKEDAPKRVTVQGTVTGIDLTGVAADGPALLTIATEARVTRTIAVPSMGWPLCPAFPQLASVYDVAVGDSAAVRGALSEDGRIVPCERVDDYLHVARTVTDYRIGFSFAYPVGQKSHPTPTSRSMSAMMGLQVTGPDS